MRELPLSWFCFLAFAGVSLAGAAGAQDAAEEVVADSEGAGSDNGGSDQTRPESAPGPLEPLPPVSIDELAPRAQQPSFDAGVLMAPCGVGSSPVFQRTRFCLGGMFDVLYFRKHEDSPAFGGYGQLATAGFQDFRASLGVSGLVPLVAWVNVGLRGGALLVAGAEGVAPGFEGYLEVGQRSFSYTGRYSMSHMLFFGMQWNSPGAFEQPSGTTIWIGARLDGYWLSAPGLLFQ
jgi:hypothetical protein